ncbi:helix-turn-helix transcriptional regulator [Agromyces subbeticus]|uniref:helix-turn-helix transcriptional regulator n=1 Tax=Agromyces subbeticus TaxID=293890 RepID=UPI0003B5B9D4|nr:helix-turn-helix transcriptional regulator [Agromyces subbeticus]
MTLVEEVRAQKAALPSPVTARLIRLAADVTQARMAQELGVSRVTIARWEAGTRRPRGKMMLDYRRVLDELREAV